MVEPSHKPLPPYLTREFHVNLRAAGSAALDESNIYASAAQKNTNLSADVKEILSLVYTAWAKGALGYDGRPEKYEFILNLFS